MSLVESNAEQLSELYSLQYNVLTALNEFNASINNCIISVIKTTK